MSSESARVRAQIETEHAARVAARLDARNYILARYRNLGFTEAEADDILGALGIFTEEDCRTLGLYEARNLTRGALGSSAQKAVMPRTPPTRAASP